LVGRWRNESFTTGLHQTMSSARLHVKICVTS
jgi:hypothetical protein